MIGRAPKTGAARTAIDAVGQCLSDRSGLSGVTEAADRATGPRRFRMRRQGIFRGIVAAAPGRP